MKMAIVAATEMELSALRDLFFPEDYDITFYVHGVGIVAATYHLQKLTESNPDYIIQVGIAGAYNESIAIGSSVVVTNELIEQGAEDKNVILDLFELNLLQQNEIPYRNTFLSNHNIPEFVELPKVNALTVSMSSGTQQTIEKRIRKFNADIETMEGACLHYVCLMAQIPFMQFRGISNKVEVRNRDNWQIQSALQSCHEAVHQFIHQLNVQV